MQQEDPLEAINERNIASVTRDEAVLDTLRLHALPVDGDAAIESHQNAETAANDDGDAAVQGEDAEQWNSGSAGDELAQPGPYVGSDGLDSS